MYRRIHLYPMTQGAGWMAENMSYQFHGENEAAEWRKGVVADIRSIQADIKTILQNMVTRPEVERMLDRKVDTSEHRTYRGWQDDRYQRLDRYPIEQLERRNSTNISLQTLSQFLYAAIAIVALIVALLKP